MTPEPFVHLIADRASTKWTDVKKFAKQFLEITPITAMYLIRAYT